MPNFECMSRVVQFLSLSISGQLPGTTLEPTECNKRRALLIALVKRAASSYSHHPVPGTNERRPDARKGRTEKEKGGKGKERKINKRESRKTEKEAMRYETRCCFNVRSKADISHLNLPHETNN